MRVEVVAQQIAGEVAQNLLRRQLALVRDLVGRHAIDVQDRVLADALHAQGTEGPPASARAVPEDRMRAEP